VQAPMAFESGMAGPVVRDWDGGRCSLYKCCGDCACDCEQGWCVRASEERVPEWQGAEIAFRGA